ncbi:MAG: hypothetical protein J0I09_00540 [Sphingobacteriia bacterium]|nr:hypothetical protein [Sphingobacteriia bacterium]
MKLKFTSFVLTFFLLLFSSLNYAQTVTAFPEYYSASSVLAVVGLPNGTYLRLTDRVWAFSNTDVLLGSSASMSNNGSGIAADPVNGDVWVVDGDGINIRKYNSSLSSTGTYSSLLIGNPFCIAVDANQKVYIGQWTNGVGSTGNVVKMNNDGTGVTTLASGFNHITGITVDASGNIYISEFGSGSVKKLNSSGTVIATYTGFTNPCGLSFDAAGYLHVADRGTESVKKLNSSGTVIATYAAGQFSNITGISFEATGNLLVADQGNNKFKRVYIPNYWTGATSTDWATTTNWSAALVPTSATDVIIPSAPTNQPTISTGGKNANSITIQSNAKLTVSPSAGASALSVGTITVNPNAALIGSSDNITIYNQVNIQTAITGQRGYRMFANPFTSALTTLSYTGLNATTTTENDVKTYNNATSSWVSAGTGYSSVNIAANQAYACFIRGAATDNITGLNYTTGPSAFTYTVSGSNLNSSSYTVPAATGANFSLVGNPYTAPVNSIALAGGANPYYIYKINQNVINAQTKAGGWVPVTNADGVTPVPALGVIALKTAGNYNIKTSDINLLDAPANNLFGIKPPIATAEIIAEHNGNYADKIFVRLDVNATGKSNDQNDLAKLYNESVNFYAKAEDGKPLAIDSRNCLTTIPLVFNTNTAGNYSFKLTTNSLPEGTTVILKDNFTNTQTALKLNEAYSFSVTADKATYGEERFLLMFNSNKITALQDQTINDGFKAEVLGNITNSNLIGLSVSGATGTVNVKVFDISGKQVKNTSAVNGIQYIGLENNTNGMMLIQITDTKGNRVTKKIMKF